MKYILKEMKEDAKPRAKAKTIGVNNLSDYELLAIILKTGTKEKSAIDLAIEILNYYSSLNNMGEASINELMQLKGIGEVKAIELLASIELGKRIINKNSNDYVIKKSIDAYYYLKKELENLKQEHFVCIYLNSNSKVICHKTISIGNGKETIADYKSALKWALKFSSFGVIFAHNHPSGEALPSFQDNDLCNKLKLACSDLDIAFIDNIIIGDKSYYSYRIGKKVIL